MMTNLGIKQKRVGPIQSNKIRKIHAKLGINFDQNKIEYQTGHLRGNYQRKTQKRLNNYDLIEIIKDLEFKLKELKQEQEQTLFDLKYKDKEISRLIDECKTCKKGEKND